MRDRMVLEHLHISSLLDILTNVSKRERWNPMRCYQKYLSLGLLILCLLSGCATSSTQTSQNTKQPTQNTKQSTATGTSLPQSSIPGLKLPPGFQISVYAKGFNIPRFITIGPKGVLLVAERGANSVVALPPGTSPEQSASPIVIASGLHDPTSLVMHNGYLYVGEGSSIARMAMGKDLKAVPIKRIITELPLGRPHNTRTV